MTFVAFKRLCASGFELQVCVLLSFSALLRWDLQINQFVARGTRAPDFWWSGDAVRSTPSFPWRVGGYLKMFAAPRAIELEGLRMLLPGGRPPRGDVVVGIVLTRFQLHRRACVLRQLLDSRSCLSRPSNGTWLTAGRVPLGFMFFFQTPQPDSKPLVR